MADTKISNLNALTKSTVDAADVLPVEDISSTETKKIQVDELLQPKDSIFRVVGSSDTTKKVAFEVDGLTTATTRTLTISDEDGTIITNNNTITVNNKTIGSNTGVALGSDATGDIYYRNASGKLARLAIGSPNYILNANASGVPEWTTNPAVVDASTTAKGSVEVATTAEINSGASTGGTGASLVITPSGLAGSAPTFSAANLTNLPATASIKTGYTTRDMSTTTTTTIAHGLGRTPKLVTFHVNVSGPTTAGSPTYSYGTYDGTTQVSNFMAFTTNGSTATAGIDTTHAIHYSYGASGVANTDQLLGTVSVDSTNITITWTKNSSPTGTGDIVWAAHS